MLPRAEARFWEDGGQMEYRGGCLLACGRRRRLGDLLVKLFAREQ